MPNDAGSAVPGVCVHFARREQSGTLTRKQRIARRDGYVVSNTTRNGTTAPLNYHY